VSGYSTNEIDPCLITNSHKVPWLSAVVPCQILIPRVYHRLPNNRLARSLNYLFRWNLIRNRKSTLLDFFNLLLLLLEGWMIWRHVLPHVPHTTTPLWPPSGWSSRRSISLPHPSPSIRHGDPPEHLRVSRLTLATRPDVLRPVERDWLPQKSLIPAHRVTVFRPNSSLLHQILADPHQAVATML
jgi:hypothetical protein